MTFVAVPHVQYVFLPVSSDVSVGMCIYPFSAKPNVFVVLLLTI